MPRRKLSHVDERGRASMVDVGAKPVTRREAEASCFVALSPATLRLVRSGKAPKGEVLNTARIAGIHAAKRTFELIPLAHPIPVDAVAVDLAFAAKGIRVSCRVRTDAKTGAEMEALTGAALAALTIYDMVKAVERGAVISRLRLESKSGGKSGVYRRAR